MIADGAPHRYLAFDTSGPVGSVAVGRGLEVLGLVSLPERGEHAARIVPAIDEALRAAATEQGRLSGVIVGEGPGSFTGVRVAAATAKGLIAVWRLPLWTVSSLAAAALATNVGPVRYALFDARGDRVYGACYGIGGLGVRTLLPPHAGRLRDVLDGEIPPGAVFVGDGSDRHRQAIEGAGFSVAPAGASVSLAEGLLRFLDANPESPPVTSATEWEPRYVRPWNVEPPWTG